MSPDPQTRLRALAVLACTGLVAAAGCDASPTESDEPDGPTMDEVRDRTTTATRELVEALEPLDLTATRAIGGPDMCTDDGSDWRYRAEVSLELPNEQRGSHQLADHIRDQLAAKGWQPYESEGSFEDGVDVTEDHGWLIRVQRDGIQDVVITTLDFRQRADVEVLGECVPATDEQRDAYIAEDRQPIDLAE